VVRGAVFFDVDGTLVPNTSSSQHLAGFLGQLDELAEAEDAYAAARMDNREVSVLDAAGWRGRVPSDIASHLQHLPLVDGIADVVAWCREHDLAPYLATLAWQPVGEYLCQRFGFEGACGPTLDTADGRYSGQVAQHFDEFDKRDFALDVANSLNLAPTSCAAVGDSRSDLPLFKVVGLCVGFNASKAVRAVADAAVDGSDLRAVLPALDRWISAA
jgi:phosphoserine phosphatase